MPGTGRPIAGRGELYDEDWWIKQWVRREEITGAVPASLKIRKDAEELMERLTSERHEESVRRIVTDFNERIDRARRGHVDGPPVFVDLLDVEMVVRKPGAGGTATPVAPPGYSGTGRPRSPTRAAEGVTDGRCWGTMAGRT